jgi:hypothetical protein
LPIRQGPVTITDITSDGSRLVLAGNVSSDITPGQWADIKLRLQEEHCSGTQASIIRRGGSITAHLTDSTGEKRSFTTAKCLSR